MPKASYGYGGKFGVEKDRMDKVWQNFTLDRKHVKHLFVLTSVFSSCRWHWAMTMWRTLSSTLPRRTLPKVLEGNLVFRKTVSTGWEYVQELFQRIHLLHRLTYFWQQPQAAIRGTARVFKRRSVQSSCEPSASSCVCSLPWALSTKERCSNIRLKKVSQLSGLLTRRPVQEESWPLWFCFFRLLQGIWREVWRGEGESGQSGSGLWLQGPDREASVTKRWVCVLLTAVI